MTIADTVLPLGQTPPQSSQTWWFWFSWLFLPGFLVIGCETQPTGPTNFEDAASVEWEEVDDEADATEHSSVEEDVAATVVHVPEVIVTPPVDDHPPVLDTPPTRLLRERFDEGAVIQRRARLERTFSVATGDAATASGSTETVAEYTVQVEAVIAGQILDATVSVVSDTLRVLSSNGVSPAHGSRTGPLEGVDMSCEAVSAGGYDCAVIDSEVSWIDHGQVLPQRMGLLPGRAAPVGQTWTLSGAEAENFLGVYGADVTIEFVFDDANAVYRDQPCYHVTYSISGGQQVELSGQPLTAEVNGTGEVYFYPDAAVVLFHRQERDTEISGRIFRRPETLTMERSEHIVFEEETFLEP